MQDNLIINKDYSSDQKKNFKSNLRVQNEINKKEKNLITGYSEILLDKFIILKIGKQKEKFKHTA